MKCNPGATGNQDPRRRPRHRAPPSEQRPADLAATTASDADEARNIQAPDRRCSTRPRSSRDRSRRTALEQRLRRLAARRPPHSLRLRRRWTPTASTTNRIGVSWVIPPSHELRGKFRATRAVPAFPGTSELAFIPDREIFTVPASRRLRSRPRRSRPHPGRPSARAYCSSLVPRASALSKAETRAPALPTPRPTRQWRAGTTRSRWPGKGERLIC